MKNRSFSWLYAILHPVVYIAARLFYRRWIVLSSKNFPDKGEPAILVSNHQNALIDPLVFCLTAPRQLHFLTRADVFRNPLLRPFVLALNMLPVFRVRDKEEGKQHRNMKTFQTAIARMGNGAVVGIFPEGNHGEKKILRPLKKGLAQLLDITAENKPELRKLSIIPVGVDYSNYDRARSSVVVNYGEAFTVDDLLFSEDDKIRRYRAVMSRVQERLDNVMLNLSPDAHYHYLRMAEQLMFTKYGYARWADVQQSLHNLRNQISHDATAVDQINQANELFETASANNVDFYDIQLHQSGGQPTLVRVLLSTPLVLPGFLLHVPAWQLTLVATKKVITDPQFNSTFRLLFGMLFFGLTWVVTISLSFVFLAPNVSFLLLGLLFLSSLGALPFSDRLLDIYAANKGRNFLRDHPDAAKHWDALKTDIENRMAKIS